jgi:hypothetical protein
MGLFFFWLIYDSYMIISYYYMWSYFFGDKKTNGGEHIVIDIFLWLLSPIWFMLVIFNKVCKLMGE